jgi:hypothetical protein
VYCFHEVKWNDERAFEGDIRDQCKNERLLQLRLWRSRTLDLIEVDSKPSIPVTCLSERSACINAFDLPSQKMLQHDCSIDLSKPVTPPNPPLEDTSPSSN